MSKHVGMSKPKGCTEDPHLGSVADSAGLVLRLTAIMAAILLRHVGQIQLTDDVIV